MTRLATLMLSLVYPASLGAAIVWLLTSVASDPLAAIKTPSTYYGLWLLVYFSVGFLVLSQELDKRGSDYKGLAFILDLVDVVLIFLCFLFLGHVDSNYPFNYQLFCVSAALVPVFQSAWNVAFDRSNQLVWGVVFGVVIVFLVGYFFGDEWPWYQWIALLPLVVILEVYRRTRVAS